MSLNQVEPGGLRDRDRVRCSRARLVRFVPGLLRRPGGPGPLRSRPVRAPDQLRCPRFGLVRARTSFSVRSARKKNRVRQPWRVFCVGFRPAASFAPARRARPSAMLRGVAAASPHSLPLGGACAAVAPGRSRARKRYSGRPSGRGRQRGANFRSPAARAGLC